MLLGIAAARGYVWLAFVGAGLATVVVYGVASLGREGATPVKLALAGAAVTAGLTSLTTAIVHDQRRRARRAALLAGRLAGRALLAGLLADGAVHRRRPGRGALVAGRALNGLALGDDVARALGQRVRLHPGRRCSSLVAVLCGAATAACGPIVFVGLVVPHLARLVCGPDYRWILPYSLVLAPIAAARRRHRRPRSCSSPGELQVGVVLGVLGAPVFVALVRYRNLAEL